MNTAKGLEGVARHQFPVEPAQLQKASAHEGKLAQGVPRAEHHGIGADRDVFRQLKSDALQLRAQVTDLPLDLLACLVTTVEGRFGAPPGRDLALQPQRTLPFQQGKGIDEEFADEEKNQQIQGNVHHGQAEVQVAGEMPEMGLTEVHEPTQGESAGPEQQLNQQGQAQRPEGNGRLAPFKQHHLDEGPDGEAQLQQGQQEMSGLIKMI